MVKDIILYPSCSVWVGRLIGVEHEKTIHDEGTDHEWEEVEEDYTIATDSFPNDGLIQAMNAARDGYGINDIEWDNSGGGAHGDYLEDIFNVAKTLRELEVKNDVEYNDEQLQIIDAMCYNGDGDGKEAREFLKTMDDASVGLIIPIVVKRFNSKVIAQIMASDKVPKKVKEMIIVEKI